METIIKKAVEGGYKTNHTGDNDAFEGTYTESDIVLDSLFWQALGKACGWRKVESPRFHWAEIQLVKQNIVGAVQNHTMATAAMFYEQLEKMMKDKKSEPAEIVYALRFHEINLTEGWEPAIKYLEDLVK